MDCIRPSGYSPDSLPSTRHTAVLTTYTVVGDNCLEVEYMYSIAYFLRVGEIGSSIYSTYYIHTEQESPPGDGV